MPDLLTVLSAPSAPSPTAPGHGTAPAAPGGASFAGALAQAQQAPAAPPTPNSSTPASKTGTAGGTASPDPARSAAGGESASSTSTAAHDADAAEAEAAPTAAGARRSDLPRTNARPGAAPGGARAKADPAAVRPNDMGTDSTPAAQRPGDDPAADGPARRRAADNDSADDSWRSLLPGWTPDAPRPATGAAPALPAADAALADAGPQGSGTATATARPTRNAEPGLARAVEAAANATAGPRDTAASAPPTDGAAPAAAAGPRPAAQDGADTPTDRPAAPALPALPALPAASTGGAAPVPVAEAPALPFQARLSAAVGSADFAPGLSVQVSLLVREGVQQAELHLHPAEMGPIAVKIALDGPQAQVLFQAEHAATRSALQDSLPTLASALGDAGFTLTDSAVSAPPAADTLSSSLADTGGSAGGRPQDGSPSGRPGGSRWATGLAGPADEPAASAGPRPAPARGLVDLVA